MPRLNRLTMIDTPHHIIQRGNNRSPIFFEDVDYRLYLDKLKYYAEEYDVHIHAFVLMTNHVHVLLSPKNHDGISRLFQSLGRYYARYVKQTYGRPGGLWEGRYKSTKPYLLLI